MRGQNRSEKKPAILFGNPKQPDTKSDRPKILAAGKQRNRIPCSLQDLSAFDASAHRNVLDEALRAVNGVNLDDHYFDDVVRFGSALQEEHGKLSEVQLSMISADALAKINGTYLALIEKLERLEPQRAFGARSGAVQRMKQLFSAQLNEKAFAAEYNEIKSLSQSLESAMPSISDLADRLKKLSKDYKALAQSLFAHVLASRFIVKHIDTLIDDGKELTVHYQSQRDALEGRQASLLATMASVEVGQRTLTTLSQNISDFGLLGFNITREELPAWQAAFSAALLAKRAHSQDESVLNRLYKAHKSLASKLKRKERT
jgi:hypothetical protein